MTKLNTGISLSIIIRINPSVSYARKMYLNAYIYYYVYPANETDEGLQTIRMSKTWSL
jgi:hypothetical protein